MNVLDQIIKYKRKEVEERKSLHPINILEKSLYFESPTFSLSKHILQEDKSGIIAEFKRKSPSKGVINPKVSIEKTSMGYVKAGASALSVLTDEEFFGGSNYDLMVARKNNACPILRKDFVVDEYQIIEAKSIGADAILLIAAVLTPDKIKVLSNAAHTVGLEVLLEVHDESELRKNLDAHVDLIGVNNRNLKTFEVNIETSKRLSSLIPKYVVKISESGIDDPKAILELRKFGFKGFLIGQAFMEQESPEMACKAFVDELRELEKPTV